MQRKTIHIADLCCTGSCLNGGTCPQANACPIRARAADEAQKRAAEYARQQEDGERLLDYEGNVFLLRLVCAAFGIGGLVVCVLVGLLG